MGSVTGWKLKLFPCAALAVSFSLFTLKDMIFVARPEMSRMGEADGSVAPTTANATTTTPWDPSMVEPVHLKTSELTGDADGENLNSWYKAEDGGVITFNHTTVLWGKGMFLYAKKASRQEASATDYDLVADTAFAFKRTQRNIQHFLFDDLVGLFGYLYLTHKGLAKHHVVLWPAADVSKLGFQKNVFDELVPSHYAVELGKKVLVRKTLHYSQTQGAIWKHWAFDWRHDLQGIPPRPPHGQRFVVLDELRSGLSRSVATKKAQGQGAKNQCMPQNPTKIYSTRVQLTAARILQNVKELHSLLEEFGYVPWNPMECSSLSARYEALQNTKILVSEYGSDMCNLLWLQRGATVVDLVHPGASYIQKHLPIDWNYGFFEAVSEGLGIRHEPIFAGERRPSPKNVLGVREGHSYTRRNGTTVTVSKDHPKAEIRGTLFPEREWVVKVPAKDITHIDGKPLSLINLTAATPVVETPGIAFHLTPYNIDWVVDVVEVRKQLRRIEERVFSQEK
uniref:Glycosyltransferase 61 catalytic domain-containing protein n=1 Tax=Lotharella globosa TaxID=91324 RepID=A0A7S4DPD8_9EUKA|mmetsp:Transcript_19768/g.40008  ORF Transcript_19768/g.40008 Transcript_19768/m.40008 type:complete len:509 (+) Transcript_19768:23-1549(+)|eukprot:CAMPEP_0167790252 /NCGR_PEP_ID=MMETSP0111_2-20121227/11192_1 /TAXON_ID=91324 /ORGANISM="Lotharella globosa, Strain CCCM811" /LENGTH=508 /DNA_ID=CAMNT_0007682619 /DNA_START=11 /DNA_END=1537 /DNA_ORIENTATION=-